MNVKRLCSAGRLEFASLIAETYSPEEAPQVCSLLAEESAFTLIQFDWREL